ncbi:tRNA (adenosine(37)-N6)-dimethylallyltransferase MiaA [Staphylospora marina]|uniref:tRNA (adenosine(37)-N6)-dimethylallyltransferase MiaA n=1 Tax=Staphylospora marina TaxID=2490858 RepID=UPI000F5BD0C6|nr:tRNA (adenosine(37)-N6)-dimethylallyltransferase MiaA [Staphylospora marina]
MKPPLLIIVGPTASGKTGLGIRLAKRFDGEVVSGDSMQIYRGMDIGTAKVTPEEQEGVPHHLIDIIEPDVPFSVSEFKTRARRTIADIQARGKLPILVGGTGLYIEAVVHDYLMPQVRECPETREKYRRLAEERGNEALHRVLAEVDPETAARLHPNDVKRVIRALEVYEITGKPLSKSAGKGESPYDALWIGLTMRRDRLYERINRRVDEMLDAGLIDEVRRLVNRGYGRHLTSMQGIGYKEIISFLEGEISREEAVRLIKKGTRKYAKRQLSWFRRLSEIHWFDAEDNRSFPEIVELVAGKFQADGE